MELENRISEMIVSRRQPGARFMVAVCGAADLGKSYLSAEIVRHLRGGGENAACLPMDAFLMDRTRRIEKGISGYSPDACDLDDVHRQVIRFQGGEDIAYFPYRHQSGEKAGEPCTICGADILIIEGLHAMHQRLMPYIGLSIFLYTADDYLRKIRHEADILKRKQTPEFSRRVELPEFQQYKQWVAPYRASADVCLCLEQRWQYHIEYKNGQENHI